MEVTSSNTRTGTEGFNPPQARKTTGPNKRVGTQVQETASSRSVNVADLYAEEGKKGPFPTERKGRRELMNKVHAGLMSNIFSMIWAAVRSIFCCGCCRSKEKPIKAPTAIEVITYNPQPQNPYNVYARDLSQPPPPANSPPPPPANSPPPPPANSLPPENSYVQVHI